MWIIIQCILIAIGVVCLFAPITFRFQFDDKIKKAAAGYFLLSFEVDMIARQMTIWFNGYAIKRIDQTTPSYKKHFTPVMNRVKRAAGRRVKIREIIKNGRKYLRIGAWFVKKFTVNYLNLHIAGGFADPYYTGNTYAVYTVACGILPGFMSHITYQPDFSADTFLFKGRGKISIRVVHIVYLGCRILKDMIIMKFRDWYTIRKKGVSYG